jgi:hypothetical protein
LGGGEGDCENEKESQFSHGKDLREQHTERLQVGWSGMGKVNGRSSKLAS